MPLLFPIKILLGLCLHLCPKKTHLQRCCCSEFCKPFVFLSHINDSWLDFSVCFLERFVDVNTNLQFWWQLIPMLEIWLDFTLRLQIYWRVGGRSFRFQSRLLWNQLPRGRCCLCCFRLQNILIKFPLTTLKLCIVCSFSLSIFFLFIEVASSLALLFSCDTFLECTDLMEWVLGLAQSLCLSLRFSSRWNY